MRSTVLYTKFLFWGVGGRRGRGEGGAGRRGEGIPPWVKGVGGQSKTNRVAQVFFENHFDSHVGIVCSNTKGCFSTKFSDFEWKDILHW